jgi:hypothetical protein
VTRTRPFVRKMPTQLLTIAFLLFGVFALAEDAAQEKSYTMCRSGSVVRTIRIFKPQGTKQCRVTYTKDGVDQVAGGAKEISICENVRQKIQTNLEKQHWKCKEVSLVAVDDDAANDQKKK